MLRDVAISYMLDWDRYDIAKRLLERRYKQSDLNDPKQQRRAVAFLLRRGYSSKVIFNILKYSAEEP